jgi:hypothetical protein
MFWAPRTLDIATFTITLSSNPDCDSALAGKLYLIAQFRMEKCTCITNVRLNFQGIAEDLWNHGGR